MLVAFSLVLIFVGCYFWIGIVDGKTITEKWLLLIIGFFTQILVSGYAASFCGKFGQLQYWVLWQGLITFLLGCLWWWWSKRIFSFKLKMSLFNESLSWVEVFLGLVVGTILVLQLILVVCKAPHNIDSLTYHLARMAYYIQHNQLEFYPANQWPQTDHPKNSTVLLAYFYLIGGENMTQLVQYLSYVTTGCIVYGISRQLGLPIKNSRVSALLSFLPISLVMGSTTAQNDLLINTLAGIAIYFSFNLKKGEIEKTILLMSLAMGLMIGCKASSFLNIPLVLLFGFWNFPWKNIRKINLIHFFRGIVAGGLIIGTVIYVCGYRENWQMYGHPIGPASVRHEHSYEGWPLEKLIHSGLNNCLRYAANFTTWDGFLHGPSFIYDLNSIQWKINTFLFSHYKPSIYESFDARMPFGTFQRINADEEKSFFGPIGFLLFWPLGLFYFLKSLYHFIQKRKWEWQGTLAMAALGVLLIQSFAGYYDPWRGRMFGTAVFFMAPLVGYTYFKYSAIGVKGFLTIIFMITAWAAVWSILFRDQISWILPNYTGKIWYQMSRMEQMMSDSPYEYSIYKQFDTLVPENGVVVSSLLGSFPEYVLFGKKLTRTVITDAEYKKSTVSADYHIFVDHVIKKQPSDRFLGEHIYLRKLK